MEKQVRLSKMPESTEEHLFPVLPVWLPNSPKPVPAPEGPISEKDRQAQNTTAHQQGQSRRMEALTLAANLAHSSAVGPYLSTCEGSHYEPAALQDMPTAFHTGRDNKTGAASPAISTRILKDNSGYKTSFIPSNTNLKRTWQETVQDSP